MQRDRLAVPLGGPDTSQTKLFLQNQAALDDEDFLDNGNDRHVALLSNRRGGVHGLADGHTLDFHGLASKSLVDEVVMTYRMNLHANFSLDFPPLDRNVSGMISTGSEEDSIAISERTYLEDEPRKEASPRTLPLPLRTSGEAEARRRSMRGVSF
jgi:hypothetical protein